MPNKYVNNSERVFAFNNKFIIPKSDAVELTDAEEKSPLVQEYIKRGELVKQVEADAAPSNEPGTPDDSKNAKK